MRPHDSPGPCARASRAVLVRGCADPVFALSRSAGSHRESAGGSEVLPRFAGSGVTLTIDFRRQSLNRAIDRSMLDAAAPARCPGEQQDGRNASCREHQRALA